jgi:membrane protein YdbS with pleckstrin-like domain
MSSAFYMDDGEELLLKIRKHWFLVFMDFAMIKFFALLPFIVIFIFPSLVTGAAQQPVMICLSAWFLLCIIAFATVWTNYYLDLWVVTNKRIVVFEQLSLFHREETTMRMERIQDTTIEINGFFPSFFNYGNLTVNTAGEHTKNHTFEGIPDPEAVKALVIERVDAVTEHKSKLEFSDVQQPSHGV